MTRVDRAVCENDTSGFMKIITKKDGAIVGATVVAARAGETIVELIIAMKEKLKIKELAGDIHPYPTYSTVVQQIAADITVENLLAGVSRRVISRLPKTIP